MAGPIVEPEAVMAEVPEKPPVARAARGAAGRAAAAVLAPSAAALVALLVHRFLPGRLSAPEWRLQHSRAGPNPDMLRALKGEKP